MALLFRYYSVFVSLIIVCRSQAEGDQSRHPEDSPPQSAVVSLFTYDRQGSPAFHATGFFVSADGLIATNRHVIQNISNMTVQTHDGLNPTVLGVVAEDPVHDLVILRIRGTGYPYFRLGTFEEVRPGAEVRVICDEYGFDGRVLTGTVANVENLADDYQWFAIKAKMEEGESGSPVLDETGRVDGIVIGQFENHTKGMIVSVDSIKHLLISRNAGVDPESVTKLENRSYVELYDDPNLEPALYAENCGHNEEAVRRMTLVCDDFPRSAAAYALLGSYYSRLLMWKEANDALSKAINIRPDYAFAMASLGAVLAYQGKSEEATRKVKEAGRLALELHSRFADTWYNVGGTLMLLKQYAEARKIVQLLRNLKTPEADHSADQLAAILQGKL